MENFDFRFELDFGFELDGLPLHPLPENKSFSWRTWLAEETACLSLYASFHFVMGICLPYIFMVLFPTLSPAIHIFR